MIDNAPKIPESVLDAADWVLKQATDVTIDTAALAKLKQPIFDQLARGLDTVEEGFGTTGSLDGDINLIFFETAANFCFWAQQDSDKWTVAFDGQTQGGWYGLSRAFYRAIKASTPVHDAAFMSHLTLTQAAELFEGTGTSRIPLLEIRVNNIVEAADFLLEHHHGSARSFVESCDMSAPRIAEAVTANLNSFRDGAWYDGRWVWILKRAQILPNDLSQLSQKYPEFRIKDLDQLTIFADYRLPQVLEHFGVLQYSASLKRRLNARQLIPSQSAAEVEIRLATIAACEQLKAICGGISSANIDLALWLMSQDIKHNPDIPPHHLTISSFY